MKVTAFTLVGLLVLVGGCSNGAPSRMMQPREPAVAVRPADGETGVRLDAEIVLAFAAPVDAAVVESDVHLFSARDMADTLCPHEAMMPHGGMSEAMTEPTRMRHMEEFHRSPGAFTWSDGMRRCAFRPDSMMAPSTQHMIHFGPAAMDMMENRMDGAMMDGHGSGEMARHMMFHFVTMDATGGHGGHHP